MVTREAVFMFTSLFLVPSLAWSAATGSVTFSVVTSFGVPLAGGEVHIDGQHFQKVVTIKGRTTVTLPYGVYRLTSEPSAYYWASERFIEVIVPDTFILVALARKETFAVSGEGAPTPYTVSGTLASGRIRTGKLFARLRGLYLPNSSECEIDEKGHFELAVGPQGTYAIEILDGESIVSAKTIRLDETKPRPVRVEFTAP